MHLVVALLLAASANGLKHATAPNKAPPPAVGGCTETCTGLAFELISPVKVSVTTAVASSLGNLS